MVKRVHMLAHSRVAPKLSTDLINSSDTDLHTLKLVVTTEVAVLDRTPEPVTAAARLIVRAERS